MFFLGFLWSLPTTLLGLALALVLGARPYKLRPAGSWWWVGGWGFWGWWYRPHSPWQALTLAHITIANKDWADDTVVIRHERSHLLDAHVWGPFFLGAYLCGWLNQLVTHGRANAYRSSPMEAKAYQYQKTMDRWG